MDQDKEKESKREGHNEYEIFVAGAEGFITYNRAKSLNIVNGTPIIYQDVSILTIDATMLNVIEQRLSQLSGQNSIPYHGCAILASGDLHQLSPIGVFHSEDDEHESEDM